MNKKGESMDMQANSPLNIENASSSGGSMNRGFTCALLCCVLVSAVGSGFQQGYNTGVINSPKEHITNWIKSVMEKDGSTVTVTTINVMWSIVVSMMCIGGMIGGLTSGMLANCLGRKGGMLFNNIFAIAAGLMQGYAKDSGWLWMLIVGRFLIGINSGLATGLAPMYLVDISPSTLRGAMGSVYQLVVTISILISQIVSMKAILGTEDLWQYLFYLMIIPAILQIVFLPFCVESPRYLTSQGKEQQTEKALMCLRHTTNVQDELEELKAEYESETLEPQVTLKEMFSNRMLRIKIMITMTIMLAQQLSGINAVMYFSTHIFKTAKLSDDASEIATILMGLVNVLMTLISVILVEVAGRKTLLLVGFGGMFFVTALLTVALVFAEQLSYACIVLVILFVVFFATGPGSIPWFLVSELFPSNARPLATSISVGVNWTANTMVALGFLPIQELLKSYIFVIFAVLQGLFFLFIWKKVPETKNKTVEEITSELRRGSYE